MDREAMIAALIFGGSGSGGLPSVTSSDNGKSLKVVSGAWAAEDDEFVVTFTKSESTWSANKTAVNIDDAISAKQRVYGKVSASAITNNSAFSGLTLLIPLNGDCGGVVGYHNGYSFGGSFQSGTSTILVNFNIHTNPPSLANSVTAYIKEIELAPAPFIVNYTITGAAVNGVYPMSADATLAQMQAAKSAGREIKAALTTLDGTIELPLISYGSNFAAFSNVIYYGNQWVIFQIYTSNDGNSDSSGGQIVPLNTTVMFYNTSTDELSITNVPEVSS